MTLPWLKNYRHSEEVKSRIAKAGIGRIPWNKGKKTKPCSEELKRKLSEIHKGKSYHNKGFQKGHKSFWTEETRIKVSKTAKEIGLCPPHPRKEKHPNWKGGISPRNPCSPEYKFWRKSVFERDNYTCQMCFKRGGRLEADHIKRWSTHKHLRYEISNGRTLCVPCHKIITYGK